MTPCTSSKFGNERQALIAARSPATTISAADIERALGTAEDEESRPSSSCRRSRICRRLSTLSDDESDEQGGNKTCRMSWMSKMNKESFVRNVKYSYSLFLLAFCILIILMGIFANQTPVTQSSNWCVAFVTMWVLIAWLGMLEGGQGALVGLQPIDESAFRLSHPVAHKCTSLAHSGDNLKRFIVGRQFLVVLVVFGLNLCCSVVHDAVVPGFSNAVVELFLESGLAVLLITVMLGQLAAEVNATESMLDFLNTPLMYITTWACLAIEESGLLHSVYVFEHLFEAGSSSSKEEPPSAETRTTTKEKLFYWGRVVVSFGLLSYSCVVSLVALLHGQTTMCSTLPSYASISILLFLICFLGVMESMQIALFAVTNLPRSDLDKYPRARANCNLAFEGTNFKAFLIGRQICVTNAMFLLARVTTTITPPGETVLGMSIPMQGFFNSGLPGAFIVTVIASCAWRTFAQAFPIYFLASPIVSVIIRLCLALETSGVFSATWLLAKVLKNVVGFRLDEDYLGPLHGGTNLGEAMDAAGDQKMKPKSSAVDDDPTVSVSLSTSSSFSDYGSTNI